LLVQAQSGTGKTATFTIAALSQLHSDNPNPQVLILSPTRELAVQTTKVAKDIGAYKDVTAMALVGGHSVRNCIAELHRGAQVICGTPGRVFHMVQEGHLDTRDLQTLVLDEADVMLDFGFKEQVCACMHFTLPPFLSVSCSPVTAFPTPPAIPALPDRPLKRHPAWLIWLGDSSVYETFTCVVVLRQVFEIFQRLPPRIQVLLVSATMPPELFDVSKKILRDPVKILVKPEKVRTIICLSLIHNYCDND